MGQFCGRCFGWTDDDSKVLITLQGSHAERKDDERQPLLNDEHPTYIRLHAALMNSILQQPGPQRNIQDSLHEEESLKQIVDRTRA